MIYATVDVVFERTASIERKTRETQVMADINIDGTGKFDVECEIQFLKHMVETLSRYSRIDIKLRALGDNDHHIIEDVGIVLGKAIAKALGGSPIERICSKTVPMDDALVMTSLDIIDRPYVDVDCPDPLYLHFMRSFAMSAGITLHITVIRGYDNHHIIEAEFKSLGMALRGALVRRESDLSTKEKVEVNECS